MSNFSNFISSLPVETDKTNIDKAELTFDTIKSALILKHLKVKWYKELFIITYPKRGSRAAADLDMDDPLVKECRGLIVNKNYPFNIVCKGFDMFEDTEDIPKDILENHNARITATIDGSYIRVYFNRETDKWCVATNRCIEAKKARWHSYRTFYDFFQDAIKESNSILDFSKLNQDRVYLFVMCHPENRIVRVYTKAMLYHIGTLDRTSEKWIEVQEDIGIQTPPEIKKTLFKDVVNGVDDIREHVNSLDWQFPGYVCEWTDETGKVKRAKIRNQQYEHVNSLRGDKYSMVEHYLDLRNDTIDPHLFTEFMKYFPEYSVIEDSLNMVARDVHYQYMAYYVNKNINFVQDKNMWRILAELHTRFIRTHVPTTLDIVQQHVRSMPNKDLAQLLHF